MSASVGVFVHPLGYHHVYLGDWQIQDDIVHNTDKQCGWDKSPRHINLQQPHDWEQRIYRTVSQIMYGPLFDVKRKVNYVLINVITIIIITIIIYIMLLLLSFRYYNVIIVAIIYILWYFYHYYYYYSYHNLHTIIFLSLLLLLT